jgi:hypothetical protein
MADRKLIVQILGDSRSLERAFGRSTRASKAFGDQMGKSARVLRSGITTAGIAAAAGVGAFTIGATKAVRAASDLNEAINKTDVVFAGNAKAIQAWSETTANALGISQTEALGAASAFGLMLQTAGLTVDQSAEFSKSLVQLAGDMASFQNIDPSEALDKLRSGLAGEAEPLRRYGVFLSEAAVKQEAYAQGIADTGDELTEAQKVQARYSLILKQTAKQQGDFARTSDSLANASRRVRAMYQDIIADLGQAFLPIIAKATSRFADFLDEFRKAKGVRAKFSIAAEGLENLARDIFDAVANAVRQIDWNAAISGAGAALMAALEKLRGLAGQVDWEKLGRDAGRRIIEGLNRLTDFLEDVDWRLVGERVGKFLRAIDWIGILKSVGRVLLAALRAIRDIIDELGQQIAEGIGNAIGRGIDRLQTFLVRKMLELVNRILGATEFLGRLDPFKGTREKVQKRLQQMEVDTWDTVGELNRAFASIKDQSVNFDIKIRTDIPGMEGVPTFGITPLVSGITKQVDDVTKAAKGAKDAAQKGATTTERVAKDAKTAAERQQEAFDSLMESFDLRIDQAKARGALVEARKILQAQEAAIRARIAVVGRTNALLRQLYDVNQDQATLRNDLNQQRKDAKQAREFRALGLTGTGDEIIPGTKNLRKQFAQLRQNIAGTPADTAKTRTRLAQIGKVLSAGWQKAFGQLSPETREMIRDWFRDMRGEIRDGGDTLAPVAKEALNVNRLIAGLDLDPSQARKLAGRLASVTKSGSTVAPRTRTTFGAVVGPAPVTIENTLILDGQVLGRSTKRFLDKRAIVSPKQKRGPNAGV